MTERRGAFIALEGGEGAGKSTQAQMLLERLVSNGIPATLVHEPGTTALGHHLREYLKSKQRIDRDAELLLFEASRAQLMAEIIRPSLQRGVTVVADRFAASSMSYQGYGRRIGVEHVKTLNDFATRGLYPDLNILLDIETQQGLGRTKPAQTNLFDQPGKEARQDTDDTRRFEDQPGKFHERVHEGYLAQVRNDPDRWAIIDATRGLDHVHEAVWEKVRRVLDDEQL